MDTTPQSIAWFITPHGFGHAARATAVMLALQKLGQFNFHIFTQSPAWFFHESHLTDFTYHTCLTDIGLVQKTSLDEDLPGSLHRLESFYPLDPSVVVNLAEQVKRLECRLIVCDIAPLGIAVAQAAGLRSILVENFTWDWIYEGYLNSEPAFDKYIKILQSLFERADVHIQTEPVCFQRGVPLTTHPVSRPIRSTRQTIREQLAIPAGQPTLLITMGGIETAFDYITSLNQFPDVCFIIPGGSSAEIRHQNNLRLLPHHSGFYHPDLVAASDAIVGKLGYSTLAEAYAAGIPYGHIPRSRFRESPPLADYVAAKMRGMQISEESYLNGRWIESIPQLISLSVGARPPVNGADQLAGWISAYLGKEI